MNSDCGVRRSSQRDRLPGRRGNSSYGFAQAQARIRKKLDNPESPDERVIADPGTPREATNHRRRFADFMASPAPRSRDHHAGCK